MTNGEIAERIDVNINTVKLCLNKYKAGGIQRALYDDQRTGRPVEITDDAVALQSGGEQPNHYQTGQSLFP